MGNLQQATEQFFNLRFTDLLGNRYNTRAIVIHSHTATVTAANAATVSPPYMKAASHSIQTALESLPNFAIPQVEVTTTTTIPTFSSDLRENAECSNRGLCNRKTAECNCFD